MRINTIWAVRPVPTEPEWRSPEPDGSGNSVPEAHWPLCHQSWPEDGRPYPEQCKERGALPILQPVALTQFFRFSEHHPSHLQNGDPCDTAQELSILGSSRPGFKSQPSCLLATGSWARDFLSLSQFLYS